MASSRLDRFFDLTARGSTVTREVRGGIATFLTMAYILVANPSILAAAGVPVESAVACTALAAGVACLLMGLYANFPLALASGMGLNAVVAYQVTAVAGSWQTAMGVIVLNGLLILLLVLAGVREAVMNAIPRDLRLATGAGIGLFVALIGLVNGGLVVSTLQPVPPMTYGNLAEPKTLVAMLGLPLMAVLLVRGVPGALLIGIAVSTAVAWIGGIAPRPGAFGWPDLSNAFQADVVGALRLDLVPLLLAVMMVDFFDTLGTATAVADQANLIDERGRIPRVRRVLVVDSVGASIGGMLGASSVTSYVESAAGVAEGARTGLHTVVVGVLFLAAIVLAPIAAAVPAEAVAPALVVVGFHMSAQFVRIDFDKLDTALPAFLTLILIPLTYSISHGIGYGFVAYVVIKLVEGRWRDVHPAMYVAATAFALYFLAEARGWIAA